MLNLAVRDTDAQPCFRRGHRIKIGCRIVEVVPGRERCRQQPDAVLHLLRRQRVPRLLPLFGTNQYAVGEAVLEIAITRLGRRPIVLASHAMPQAADRLPVSSPLCQPCSVLAQLVRQAAYASFPSPA